MDLFDSFKIASSAMKAQRIRLNTISSNLANIETTRTPEGGPYRKRAVVFQSSETPFGQQLEQSLKGAEQGVEVTAIQVSQEPPKMVHNPSHPDADEQGFVAMPNINLLEEMADMTSATRAYEANVTVIKSAKRMALKALEIGS
ncbi:flagellar basal-body rod protein FlgC [Desulfuromonas versatilis]|uniref:Flagellar basal-body rod protein FlgC n=1 Tax=Desulfuromonas versatilis TaxID=2802975 RepID=A0ABN6E2R4_9BACT|nr:flagellar basal body rod protein FlgC [Desulfuromonas versatilis]BCR06640.1 flagellar basal-body rod protein FlgC [Desulfuromonas versatilis]